MYIGASACTSRRIGISRLSISTAVTWPECSKLLGKRANARTNLQRPFRLIQLGGSYDFVQNILIDQKVLPQALFERKPYFSIISFVLFGRRLHRRDSETSLIPANLLLLQLASALNRILLSRNPKHVASFIKLLAIRIPDPQQFAHLNDAADASGWTSKPRFA